MRRKTYHHGDLKNALIRAGTEILASEGTGGLTLRKAAQRAGVSPSAPYAHFADKQELVAAISTQGLQMLRERFERTARGPTDPRRRIVGLAEETLDFALEHPDYYRITFSQTLEEHAAHPGYLAMAHGTFAILVDLVRECQAAGVLAPGPAEVAAVELWSVVHGLVLLVINQQLPQAVRVRHHPRQLMMRILASHLRNPAKRRSGGGARGGRPARRVSRSSTRQS
jgi:AcrR family transcriptional regulator